MSTSFDLTSALIDFLDKSEELSRCIAKTISFHHYKNSKYEGLNTSLHYTTAIARQCLNEELTFFAKDLLETPK